MIYKNKAFRITMNVIMVLLTLCCILPFILLIASSFSSEADLTKYGYSFIPRGFTLAAYKYIWAIKENILRAYGMSFLITGIGTVINLVMTLLFAYPLSRKDLPGRKWYFLFPVLYNAFQWWFCSDLPDLFKCFSYYRHTGRNDRSLPFNECVLCYHDAYLYYDKRSNGSYRGIHD